MEKLNLHDIELLGMYTSERTGATNVWVGTRVEYGTYHLFYISEGKRIFINQADFYGGVWRKF